MSVTKVKVAGEKFVNAYLHSSSTIDSMYKLMKALKEVTWVEHVAVHVDENERRTTLFIKLRKEAGGYMTDARYKALVEMLQPGRRGRGRPFRTFPGIQ